MTKDIPSTLDLSQTSAEQLQSFHEALKHETRAGEATLKLYDLHKKMNAYHNSLEKFIGFREEHWVLDESEQQRLDGGKTSTAICRTYIRNIGLLLIQARQKLLNPSEEDG